MSAPGAGPEPIGEAGDTGAEAHVRVVRGAADETELAALVAGLVAAHAPHPHHAGAATEPPSAWNDRARTLRTRPSPRPGPQAWRWSSLP